MEEEIEAIQKNDTWELVHLPQGKEVIGVKWVYKTNIIIDGNIERHKARLVVKGYKQQHGKNYSDTFAPVARMETVRIVVVIDAQHKWKVYQMDVKSMFLNGVLKKEVYVVQPPGYEVEGKEDKVYRFYGLKQAPCAWYNKIDAYLLDNGFDKCDCEPTLYIKESDGKSLIVVLYVDDLIFTGSDDFVIVDFKEVMKSEFEMTDLGLLRHILGIEVKQTENGIFISQAKYVTNILERFKMQNNKLAPTPIVMGLKLSKEYCCNNVNPTLYKRMIGSLMYLTTTRPDIMYAVSLALRFMERPKETHWKATKMILSDWAGSVDDRNRRSEYVFHLGSEAISWASKKHPIVSLSTAEYGYVATIVVVCQVVWMRMMLRDLRHDQEGMTTIFCDNTSAIALSKELCLSQEDQAY
eukprot:PITA_36573